MARITRTHRSALKDIVAPVAFLGLWISLAGYLLEKYAVPLTAYL